MTLAVRCAHDLADALANEDVDAASIAHEMIAKLLGLGLRPGDGGSVAPNVVQVVPLASIGPAHNARTAMAIRWSRDLADALASGDVGAARAAHEAIGRLMSLGVAPLDDGAPVLDLGEERRRRDDGARHAKR